MLQKYQKGEYVCYGVNGVCLIDDVCEMTVAKKREWFYILRPITDRSSTFFIPVANDALTGKLRAVLSREEIDELIDSVHGDTDLWIEDRKERMEHFRSMLRECDPRGLLRMAAMLYYKKQELSAEGKKLSPSDISVLKQAISLTDNEYAFALQLSPDEIGHYIRTRVGIADPVN
ncbi:MAG: hypothetical protein IJT44_10710 [Clostridia bacterium]|nr:hypothetical protein [Clostridia bacterium]